MQVHIPPWPKQVGMVRRDALLTDIEGVSRRTNAADPSLA